MKISTCSEMLAFPKVESVGILPQLNSYATVPALGRFDGIPAGGKTVPSLYPTAVATAPSDEPGMREKFRLYPSTLILALPELVLLAVVPVVIRQTGQSVVRLTAVSDDSKVVHCPE